MPVHPNFESRATPEIDAGLIDIASMLKVIAEKLDVNTDRAHQLMSSALQGDPNLKVRARFWIDWMAVDLDAEENRR